jgi:hypothetical protein
MLRDLHASGVIIDISKAYDVRPMPKREQRHVLTPGILPPASRNVAAKPRMHRFVAWSMTRGTLWCRRVAMSVLCYVGRHKPSIHSVSRGKHGGYAALCAACGVPLEQIDSRGWRAMQPAGVIPQSS